jgi:transcriptional regulator of arginine metabolism
MEKQDRQSAIAQLVQRRRIRRQSELSAALARQGHAVDQSTLSRDLDELQIKKLNGVYAKVEPTAARNARVDVAEAVKSFSVCGPNLLVLHTLIGHAQLVGVFLDQMRESSIAGTSAGDDTVLVITKNAKSQRVALRRVRDWLGDKDV